MGRAAHRLRGMPSPAPGCAPPTGPCLAPQRVRSDCHSPSPSLNRPPALGRTCSVSISVRSAGSNVGGARVPWLCGHWTRFHFSPRPLGSWMLLYFFQRLLLFQRVRRRTQDPQPELPEGCVQLAFTPSAGPEPRVTKRLGLDLPPSLQQLPRRGLWTSDPECGAGALPSFAAWGRVRICLVNGLNTLPPVFCPLSSRLCLAALMNPPTHGLLPERLLWGPPTVGFWGP